MGADLAPAWCLKPRWSLAAVAVGVAQAPAGNLQHGPAVAKGAAAAGVAAAVAAAEAVVAAAAAAAAALESGCCSAAAAF